MGKEIRVCEVCGTINEVNSMECSNEKCKEDLVYVPITIDNEEVKEKKISSRKDIDRKKTMILTNRSLKNNIDGKVIEIPQEGCTLGREGSIELEYFNQFPFISNIHATLQYEDESLIIFDENSTNGTKVNGEKLNIKEKRVVDVGDKVKFANIEFEIH